MRSTPPPPQARSLPPPAAAASAIRPAIVDAASVDLRSHDSPAPAAAARYRPGRPGVTGPRGHCQPPVQPGAGRRSAARAVTWLADQGYAKPLRSILLVLRSAVKAGAGDDTGAGLLISLLVTRLTCNINSSYELPGPAAGGPGRMPREHEFRAPLRQRFSAWPSSGSAPPAASARRRRRRPHHKLGRQRHMRRRALRLVDQRAGQLRGQPPEVE